MPAIRAVYNKLKATTTITDALSQYDFGDGDEVAIFTTEPPEDSARIAIMLEQAGGQDVGSNGVDMFWVLIQVTVLNNKTRSDKVVRDLAMAVRSALHKQNLPTSDPEYGDASCKCGLPVSIEDENGFPGYVLQAEVLLAC